MYRRVYSIESSLYKLSIVIYKKDFRKLFFLSKVLF